MKKITLSAKDESKNTTALTIISTCKQVQLDIPLSILLWYYMTLKVDNMLCAFNWLNLDHH